MDTKDWTDALGLAVQHPVLIVAPVVIFFAGCGVAWRVRGQSATGEIAALNGTIGTLNQQLEFAEQRAC
jgi:hypothetical protein